MESQSFNLGHFKCKIKHPPPPLSSVMEKWHVLLFRESIIELGGGGEGLYFSFYSVRDCRSTSLNTGPKLRRHKLRDCFAWPIHLYENKQYKEETHFLWGRDSLRKTITFEF